MRTTVRLDDDLLTDAKRLAAERGETLTALIEEALRERLHRNANGDPPERVPIPVSRAGGGLLPGVDLDDNAAVLEIMEGRGDPD